MNVVDLLYVPPVSMELTSKLWVRMVDMYSRAVCVCLCGVVWCVIENKCQESGVKGIMRGGCCIF